MTLSFCAFMPVAHAKETGHWRSPHHAAHSLVGTIWNSDLEPVSAAVFADSVSEAAFILLGEIHNNADHHRLQAQLIRALIKTGRSPVVVFEMIPTALQGELDRHVRENPGNAKDLGKVLHWEQLGWPDWAIYQPIAEAALSANLQMFAGGLDRNVRGALAKGEPKELYDRVIKELDLERPLTSEITKELSREINDGHCNMLPESAITPMINVQRGRDAQLAKVMMSANKGDGAVLIAGSGHVRKDWAVPFIIRQKTPDAAIISIAFFEVDPERTSPSDYVQTVSGLEKPYDFIYFTPRAEMTDHCAEMRRFMQKKKSGKSGEH